MNRKQIIEFCNQNIFNQVNNQVSQFMRRVPRFSFCRAEKWNFQKLYFVVRRAGGSAEKFNFPKLFLFWFWFLKTWNFCAAHGSGFSF